MRICLVSSSFYPATFYGGPISACWDLSKKLVEKGNEIYVSTTNANGTKKLDIECNRYLEKRTNVFVKYYNEQILNKLSVQFILGIWSDIKKSDVVYIQYLFHYTVFFALIFSIFQNKKIIICPRGSLSVWGLNYKHKWKKKIWLNIFIRPFMANVRWQASSYLEVSDIKRSIPNAKVFEVNDGVDFESFQNAEELSFQDLVMEYTNKIIQDISEVFFSMGRLHKIKCFDVLIDAFSLFVKDNPNAILLIAGEDDGVKFQLEKQIIDLGLTESVFLLGRVNHKQKCDLLSNCTAFTLASEFESFGIVIAEALACGVPVVVSNKTPWKDIEINNCGIFADNEKNSFYNAFLKIINEKYDKNLIKNYVKSNFDWEVIVGKFINLTKNK